MTRQRPVALGLFLLLAVAPIVAALGHAALYSVGLAGLLGTGATLAHWRSVLGASSTWASCGLSLAVAAAVASLSAAAGLLLALAFGERLHRQPLAVALYVPLAFPGTVAALLAFQGLTRSGLLARGMLATGLIERIESYTPLVNDAFAVGIVLTHVAIAAPFLALAFERHRAHERVDELCRVAATLGATPVQRIVRVAMPVLLRRGASSIALVFVVVLGSYEIPLLLGRASPQMLSVLVMRKYGRFDLEDKPEALALAVLYTVLVAAVTALAFGRGGRDAR
jgi:putative spermidine/putrescine transport system permease protein